MGEHKYEADCWEGHGERCFFCSNQLASRHEHDHFPVPKRHGGEITVPACVNCHDLLDRQPLDTTAASWVFDGFESLPTSGRLLLAKVFRLGLDLQAVRGQFAADAEPTPATAESGRFSAVAGVASWENTPAATGRLPQLFCDRDFQRSEERDGHRLPTPTEPRRTDAHAGDRGVP
jgi:hypothetical protein